jgi:murein DD-endopeptidase MepM/ murein hydrolase activator NlpD
MAEDHSTDSPRRTVPENNALQSSALTAEEPLLPRKPRQWGDIWEGLLRLGLGEAAMRAGTVIASIALILMVKWVMESFYLKGDVNYMRDAALAAPLPTATPTIPPPPFERSPASAMLRNGIPRLALMYTILPTRPRLTIDFYEVQEGDTIIGIAERFGINPETILWGNFDTLADDPHRLQVGQSLRILPVDGVLYEWHAGDGLNGVATFFGVTVEDILNYPGNNLNPDTIGDLAAPNIEPGTNLVIPGGERAFISWSAPLISRTDPAKAKIFGSGYCGEVYEGYVGGGTFVRPAPTLWISGYDYSPSTNHWGIDIGGYLGDGIYAVDSGVVVYSGWNDWGYGNVIVIDHGNGWQSLYAHLNEIYVTCGASVSQGIQIGAMGSTGRSTGPHLHFELMDAGGNRVNPKNFLQ